MNLHRVEQLLVQNNMAKIIPCFHIKEFDIQVSECGKIFRDGRLIERRDKFISIEKTLIKKINLFASVFCKENFVDGYFAYLINSENGYVKENIGFKKIGNTWKKNKRIRCINTGMEFESATIAADTMGLDRGGVSRAARKNIPSHKKMVFEYI